MSKGNNFEYVSIVIVNHNGISFVQDCLDSVLNTQYPDFEVIVVDNASSDGSLELVKKEFLHDKRLKVIENKGSYGPARGRNIGIKSSKGKYIAFLDNDTEVDPLWLKNAIDVMKQNPKVGELQCKLLSMDERNRFDDAGSLFSPTGFLIERSDSGTDHGQFDKVDYIFSAKSAASIFLKSAIKEAGFFDEDFYMYLEETDLSWRIWLTGYEVVFSPDSVVYHAFGTNRKTSPKYYPKKIMRFNGCRNYITTIIKNLSFMNLIRILPIHIASWVGIAVFFSLKFKFLDSFYITKGILWNLFNLGKIIPRRIYIQRHLRKVSDFDIFSKVMSSRPAKYYFLKSKIYTKDGYGADSVWKGTKKC